MKVLDIAFVGCPVKEMERAKAFYEGVLGLDEPDVTELPNGRSWVEYTLPNGTLALTDIDPEWEPSGQGVSIALEVADFAAAMDALVTAGTTIRMPHIDTPICELATVLDPEGNTVTIHCKKASHPDKNKAEPKALG